MAECPLCTSQWSSQLAADKCEDQCRSDEEDRGAGRFYRSVD
jgi:hypothetical protein